MACSELLDQASDLNDELCRENCELHREAAILRQQAGLRNFSRQGRSGGHAHLRRRPLRSSALAPLVLEHVARCLDERRPVADCSPAEASSSSSSSALPSAESAILKVLSRAEEVEEASEETAALVNEKMQLKELSDLQQERLLQLELLHERYQDTQGHWTDRLASAFKKETGAPPEPSAHGEDAQEQAPVEEEPPEPVVGEEYEVVGRKGVILRETEELDSPAVVRLLPGTRIMILSISADPRRVRGCAVDLKPPSDVPTAPGEEDMPPMGWLSVCTKLGKSLIRPCARPEHSAAEDDAGAADEEGGDSVTVSTDAWLSLRNERSQRREQLAALEEQLQVAQSELELMGTVRARMKEVRAQALQCRQLCRALQERARMASAEAGSYQSPAHVPEPPRDQTRKERQEAAEEARRQHVVWRRLLSERETTAQELGLRLAQVEELESGLEERRIELQIAAKRRERERSGLKAVLSELAGMGQEREERSAPNAQERQYLQQISELEELAAMLQAKLDSLLAKETSLNRTANLRGAALQHATSLFTSSFQAFSFEGVSKPELGRPDLDGLLGLLEGLFVENFTLQGRPRRGALPASSAAAPPGPVTERCLDLSAFVRTQEDDEGSDDGSSPSMSVLVSPPRRAPVAAPAVVPEPEQVRSAADGSDGRPQPAKMSPRSLMSMDFVTISVAE